jgi:hypothetical protein
LATTKKPSSKSAAYIADVAESGKSEISDTREEKKTAEASMVSEMQTTCFGRNQTR